MYRDLIPVLPNHLHTSFALDAALVVVELQKYEAHENCGKHGGEETRLGQHRVAGLHARQNAMFRFLHIMIRVSHVSNMTTVRTEERDLNLPCSLWSVCTGG